MLDGINSKLQIFYSVISSVVLI